MPRLALVSAVFGVAVIFSHHDAHAALTWMDGTPEAPLAFCGASQSEGVISWAGYVVDPVAATPELGQVTYIHAMAMNPNCVVDGASFELFLPPGASFAVSTATPVHCLVNGGAILQSCSQQASVGPTGGAQFGAAFLPPGGIFEIQVPVVFHQIVDGAAYTVRNLSSFGTIDANVAVTVPFEPAVPQNTLGQDIGLIGSSLADAGTLPIAFTNDNGTFTVTSFPVGDFASWARAPGVQRISGDFNHDGLTDYALVGGPGWTTIPVALSQGNGRFTVVNSPVGAFGSWATNTHVTAVAGDFNRDGFTDIALVGGTGWGSIPVAFSTGNGNFSITNLPAPDFASWASGSGVRPIAGDFNHDGMTDIALVGGAGWNTLPLASSYGNGSFQITNAPVSGFHLVGGDPLVPYNFAASARQPGAQVIVGDFNKDGFADLAVVGGGLTDIEVAMSFGAGRFGIYFVFATQFAGWANTPGVKAIAGDFNGDGATDIALVGASNWGSIPIAMSSGSPNFTIFNQPVSQFASWAGASGVRPVVGDFNGDGYDDIALLGGPGWTTIPVALNQGWGNFSTVNGAATRIPAWSADSTASVFVGRVNN